MDGVIGVGAHTRYESYRQSMQVFPEPEGEEADQNTSAATSKPGFGVETQAQPATEPSLLVAIQEANLGQASDDEESDNPDRLFAAKEESEQDQLIEEILEVGFVDWAHEQWLEKIREKARQTALASMGLTEADVANMTPEMQEQVERLIKEIVEAAVRSATEGTADEEAKDENNEAKVLNPIVTGK